MSASTIEVPAEPAAAALSVPASALQPGARIVIGRYVVEVVERARPVPARVRHEAEVRLVVADVVQGAARAMPGAVWGVTAGADQRFPLAPGQQ